MSLRMMSAHRYRWKKLKLLQVVMEKQYFVVFIKMLIMRTLIGSVLESDLLAKLEPSVKTLKSHLARVPPIKEDTICE